ncbi:S-adenosyl-L-methionine-dependent methyltransferase [Corynascus novoguineensis]|uniref:S-adenosyl-L-methionine-dependent methyltransferase n=1 Tax=Corynascus novoguineensis TaxID=1126955 RepID=A0AAN7CR13_9PEZI|nr:S-adenosyl-L-methionine-dependent methyltransferase [Corynascus novoguineensis]
MASSLADTLEALAERLSKTAQNLRSGSFSIETDTVQRMSLLKAGADLLDAVTLSKDRVLTWLPQFAHITAIRLFIKWKAFEKIPTGNDATISYTELAAKLGADVSLITRFTRALVANGTLKQVGADRVAHTEFSHIFTSPNPIWAMLQQGFDSHLASWVAMPKYFDRFGLTAEPTDRLQTVLAFAEGRLGATVWDIQHADEERLRVFMMAMGVIEEQMPPLGAYDIGWVAKETARQPADDQRPLLVDVGGGRGHALKGILKLTPDLPANRCVLEDLPEVVEAARREVPELVDVQMIAMDFHKEQPVKRALVYYMRRCLHDYSDEDCVGMLQHISGAMATDSRLLIVETLLGDRPSPFQVAMDLAMMTISGKERTLDNFRDITGKAGLKITNVSQIPGGSAVIECALA